MQRTHKTIYSTDDGRQLLTLKPEEMKATVDVCGVTPDELDELATACRAAAEELRSMVAMDAVH